MSKRLFFREFSVKKKKDNLWVLDKIIQIEKTQNFWDFFRPVLNLSSRKQNPLPTCCVSSACVQSPSGRTQPFFTAVHMERLYMAKIISHVVLICESSSIMWWPPHPPACSLTPNQPKTVEVATPAKHQRTKKKPQKHHKLRSTCGTATKWTVGCVRVDSTDRHQSHLAKKPLGCAGRHCDVIAVNLAATTLNCTAWRQPAYRLFFQRSRSRPPPPPL